VLDEGLRSTQDFGAGGRFRPMAHGTHATPNFPEVMFCNIIGLLHKHLSLILLAKLKPKPKTKTDNTQC
jgi:hypothetical protein